MDLEHRIKAFVELGNRIKFISPDDERSWISAAKNSNNWFSEHNIQTAFEGIVKLLNEKDLKIWLEKYTWKDVRPKNVGVVMAGNIPMAGFHDFLSVLISGHSLYAKLSSQDNILLKKISTYLIDIEPEFKDRINFADKLNNMDAVIATGSDNTAKYFNYYFSSIPHIVRQNRISCAVINGKESKSDFVNLGKDIFLYYGMGCRNVAKMYVPEEYDFTPMLDNFAMYNELVDFNKYYHNYDYNKSIYLLNKEPHLDNGFLLLRRSEEMASPVSVVYYESYRDVSDLKNKIEANKNKIQTIVSKEKWLEGSNEFGEAQFPNVWDYADGVDTIKFLNSIE